MPNPTVGLNTTNSWAGCRVDQNDIRNLSESSAHTNGGMINMTLVVRCNGTDNLGTFNIPTCYETVSLPYSCVSLKPTSTNPAYQTTQDLTQHATGKYCWMANANKSFWGASVEYSSYDECKQQCAKSIMKIYESTELDEESFDILFPGYLG